MLSSQPNLPPQQPRLRLSSSKMRTNVPNWSHLLPPEQHLLMPSFPSLLQHHHPPLSAPSLPLRHQMEPTGHQVCDPQYHLQLLATLQLYSRRMHQRVPSQHPLHKSQQCLQLHRSAAHLQFYNQNLRPSLLPFRNQMEYLSLEMLSSQWQLRSLASLQLYHTILQNSLPQSRSLHPLE